MNYIINKKSDSKKYFEIHSDDCSRIPESIVDLGYHSNYYSAEAKAKEKIGSKLLNKGYLPDACHYCLTSYSKD